MEILISVIGKISEYLVEPIGRRAGYLVCYNCHKKKLEREAKNLEGIQSRVGHKVDAAKRKGKLIEDDVERWRTQVDENGEEVKRFFEDEVKVNKRCLGGWCPDLISRYSLGRKAKKLTEDVIELKTVGEFETVSYQAPPLGIEHMAIGGFVDFESRKKTMDEIVAALKDDNINVIGLCGLGGVGKTTAVKEVGKKAKAEGLFDEVVMAVVAQKTMETIQGEIADMLGLNFKEESIPGRASRLSRRLMECKRVLVILDDVWGSPDLEKLGIPFGGAHKGCKLMMTSRSQEVCIAMGTCQIFTIGILSKQEAWSLFKDKAGNSIDSPDLYPIATEVVLECGSLPIAIVTVGTALKDKSKEIWEDSLLQLRQSYPENISGMYEKVYLSLGLSFNLLPSQEAKSCLLLCCIFEEDVDIPLQDLVRFGVGLHLFNGIEEELVQATNRVHTLVHKLKSCYLLLDSEKEECVKMHDVVRDVIRSIATAGKDGLMLRHGLELKEWPTESTDQLYTSTSFMSNKIQDLLLLELKKWPTESTDPYAPFLSNMDRILSLEKIGDSVKVPENLFEGIKEVRVLQLRRMFIPSPPPSLALLTKLQTLCIEDCNLKDISLIGELKTLKILSFRGCSIQELPVETGKLTHLRSLDLTGCYRLKRIPPGVLSSLIRLEQLYMRNCSVRWEVEEGTSERNNVDVAELKSLSDQLTALEIELPASSAKFLGGFKKLVRFCIRIGVALPPAWFPNKHVRNELFINLDSGIPVESWINGLLKKTEYLQFQVCGVKNVLNNLNRESLEQLKSLDVDSCNELEYVIDTVDLIPQSIFRKLDSLSIFMAQNLKMICHGQLPAGSFAELRYIGLENCNRLENVFSSSTAKCLVQLERLLIKYCEMMEEIVVAERGAEEEVGSKIRFPKLRELLLIGLPSLVGFCKKMGDEIEFPRLRELHLYRLPKLGSIWPSSVGTHESDDSATATQHLFNQKVSFPRLERLTINYMENFGEIWCSQPPSCSFYELRVLNVSNCHKILHVAPFHLLKRLQNLEEVRVRSCDSVEEVVEEGHAVMLSRLKKMFLESLPKLMQICKKDHNRTIGFQNLKELEVLDCGSLRNLFDPSVTRGLVHLESLRVKGCVMMEEIVAKGEEEEGRMDKIVIPQLKILTLSDLQNLTSFCQSLYAFDLPLLDDVTVEDCPNMKTFSPGFASTPKLKKVIIRERLEEEEENLEENLMGDLNNTIQQLFQRKIKSLCELRSITVERCGKLGNVFSSDSIHSLSNVEEIKISNCHLVEVALDFVGVNVEEGCAAVPLSRLKKFELSDLPNLISVWKKLPKQIQECQKLQFLKITWCSRLENIFSPSTTKILEQLQQLDISGCEMMTEIVAKDEGDEKATDKIEFLQLRSLSLRNLPNLLGFFPKDVGSAEIHLFNGKIKSLCELRSITVVQCEKLANVFSSDSIHSLSNLEEIKISKCHSVEVALDFVGVNIEEGCAAVPLSRLKKFELSDLPKLISVWKKLPKRIQECQKLQSLKIASCSRLKNIFTPSTTKIVEQLEELDISGCEMMTEIVAEDEGHEKATNKIELLQLRHLSLSELPNLLGFFPKYVGSAEIHPFNGKIKSLCELKSITVVQCEKLANVFSSDSIHSLSNLEEIKISKCHSVEVALDFVGVNIEEGCAAVPLSRLKKFELSDLPKLISVWKKLPKRIQECQKLQSLKIASCSRLKNIFTPSTTKIVEQLEELDISGCEMMTEIVAEDEGHEKATNKIELLQLRHLSLSELPNLLGFFPKDVGSAEIHLFNGKVPAGSFAELREIYLSGCKRLENVFSSSIAKCLVQLELWEIYDCEMMEEIVVVAEREAEEEVSSKIRFPKLRDLRLLRLPSLVGFCKKMGDEIEFPQLRELYLWNLPKLRSFCLSSVGTHESDDSATATQHLFNQKVSFPRLERLTIHDMENFGEIWCSQPPSCSFYELRFLNVSNCHKILHVVPFHLLKRLQNLEEVRVRSCDSVEEVVEEGHAVMLSRLKKMFLESLPKLMQICKKDHNRTIGFQNLKELEVLDCGSLRNLFDPSVTRGLVHLEHLKVKGCVMMEEIVAKGEEQEEEEGMDKIVIPQLKFLTLSDLQNLTSFCQDLYDFDLPLLDFVEVEDCPNMKTFSSGFASTPRLAAVYVDKSYRSFQLNWMGDNLMDNLHNTIQQHYQRKVVKQKASLREENQSHPETS